MRVLFADERAGTERGLTQDGLMSSRFVRSRARPDGFVGLP